MAEPKQTVVDFLFQEFQAGIVATHSKHDIDSILEEADKLFQKAIVDAWLDGLTKDELQRIMAEKYYKETYG